jgi:hypothetical protein
MPPGIVNGGSEGSCTGACVGGRLAGTADGAGWHDGHGNGVLYTGAYTGPVVRGTLGAAGGVLVRIWPYCGPLRGNCPVCGRG